MGARGLNIHSCVAVRANGTAQMPNPYLGLLGKELIMTGSRAYSDEDYAATVDAFVEGKFLGYEKMVTSRIALPDITEKGFKQLIENKDQHIKILVTPRSSLLT